MRYSVWQISPQRRWVTTTAEGLAPSEALTRDLAKDEGHPYPLYEAGRYIVAPVHEGGEGTPSGWHNQAAVLDVGPPDRTPSLVVKEVRS